MSLIILERDGVINAKPVDFIATPSEWEPLEGALESIARLNQAGFRIVVMANDNGIEQDRISTAMITAIHSKMRRLLAQMGGRIEAVLFYRGGGEKHGKTPFDCSFSELSYRLRLDLTAIPAIGYSTTFIQAARRMNTQVKLIQTIEEEKVNEDADIQSLEHYDSLQSVTDSVLGFVN